MGRYALIDRDGNVVNLIEAEQEFIDQLEGLIADPAVNTGSLPAGLEYVPLEGFDELNGEVPRPEVGGRRDSNGIFLPPGAQVESTVNDRTNETNPPRPDSGKARPEVPANQKPPPERTPDPAPPAPPAPDPKPARP